MKTVFSSAIALLLVSASAGEMWSSTTGNSSTATAAVFTGGSYRSGDDSLGSNMLHTLKGGGADSVVHPLTVADAEAQGWASAGTGCDPNLGVEYLPEGGISRDAPLSVYFTSAGQIAGLKMTVYGSGPDFGSPYFGTSAFEGFGALGEQVNQKYYTLVEGGAETSWEMSVSFRNPTAMCSTDVEAHDIGDRLVINQHTIAESVPMTAGQADGDYEPGSCMKGMGQHYFKDLVGGSDMTFVTGNLLPITPMYYPPNDPNGKLNAFFFSSPACQNDEGDAWDNVPLYCALTFSLMCGNWCNADCSTNALTFTSPFHSPTTYRYATYHVFFSDQDEKNSLECPGFVDTWWEPAGLVDSLAGRTCPENTPMPHGASAPDASITRGVRSSIERD